MSPTEVTFLIVFFLIILVLVIAIIIAARTNHARPVGASDYLAYPGLDGTALNSCGEGRNQPCIFPEATLSDAAAQCTLLNCTMFSYSSSTQSMKIINPDSTFTNRLADSYRATAVILPG